MDFMDDASTPERLLIQKARQARVPINGTLELLPLCNLNCKMCYVRLSREEMERRGCMRTADEWLSLGRQMAEAGTLYLLLTGGEPLLFPDFRRLYLELKKLGLILTINTNGTLIDEDWADFFARNKPRRINITLYGADGATYGRLCGASGGFDRTIRAVRLLRERDVDVKISISLTRENQKDLDRVFAIGRELGVPVHIDPYMIPGTRERSLPYDMQARMTPEEAAGASRRAFRLQFSEEINRQYVSQAIARVQDPDFPRGDGRLSCLAGSCSFAINWQGQMRPCVMLMEPAVDVFRTGFVGAWQELRRRADIIRLSPKCTECELKPVCKVCAAASYWETGSYDDVPEYLCRFAGEYYRLLLEENQNER